MNTTYIPYIISLILVVAAALVLVKKGQVARFLAQPSTYQAVVRLCCRAEQYITGTKQGARRLACVCGWLYSAMPHRLQAYVTAGQLAETVNYIFGQIATTLENGTRIATQKGVD